MVTIQEEMCFCQDRVGKFKMEAEEEVEGERAELLSMCQNFQQLCSFEKSRAAV